MSPMTYVVVSSYVSSYVFSCKTGEKKQEKCDITSRLGCFSLTIETQNQRSWAIISVKPGTSIWTRVVTSRGL